MSVSRRNVICHYHIFKNSGSSFDKLLLENYGDNFLEFDGPFRFSKISQDELLKVALNSNASAISCHQINLPVPTSVDVRFLPVVFLRHPLLRLRSIHRFSMESPDTTIAAAEVTESFSSWVERCRTNPQLIQMLSNAQTRMLSAVYGRPAIARRDKKGGFELDMDQAKRNLDNVELLARTEFFNDDVAKFPALLEKYGVHFEFAESEAVNSTSTDLMSPIDIRLKKLRESIGNQCFDELLALNWQDMALYEYACERLSPAEPRPF